MRQPFVRGQSAQRKSCQQIEALELRRMLSAAVGTISIAPPDCGCGTGPATTITKPTVASKLPSTVVTVGKGGIVSTGTKSTGHDTPASTPFNIGARWSTTANGSVGVLGTGIKLTWSIVPDGTSLGSGADEGDVGSTFIAKMNALYSGTIATWLPVIQHVFDEWSAITGITYTYEPADDGAEYSDNNAGILGTRGDVRIGAQPIDEGNHGILAYNYFPDNGDMVIDANEIAPGGYMTDLSNDSMKLRNVMTHEHGHGMGLSHVCPVNETKLMEPFVSTNFDGPQFDDMLAANRLYGDFFEKLTGNNSAANATDRGTIGSSDSLNNLSIAATSDSDYFKFTLGTNTSLTFNITPLGTTYLSGAQNGDGSCSVGTSFNALAQSNLQLQLVASNGTTVMFTANSNGTGSGETLNNIALAAGTYYIRVSDAPGSPNAAQMYALNYGSASAAVTANITPVAPDPRSAPVSSITITFSEPVSGFDLGDLTLTRDAFSQSLSGATLSSGDNQVWTLGNLSTITSQLGTYTLAFLASGTGIVGNNSGQPFSGSPAESWTMNGGNGSGANDVWRIVRNPDNSTLTDVYINSATVTYSFVTNSVLSFSVSLGDGDDTFIVDYTNGSPLPTGGSTYDGGTNTTVGDTFAVVGQTVADTYNVSATSVIRTAPTSIPMSFTNNEGLAFTRGTYSASSDIGAAVSVTANAATIVQFASTQHVRDLTANDGGFISMLQNGNRRLVIKSLTLNGSGLLDMNDNDMIVDYDGSTQVPTISTLIKTARGANTWTGLGITSSSARNNGQHNTTLGAIEGSDFRTLYSTTLFDNESIDTTCVLVKYTYYGDANFNGKIDGGDYGRIDSTFNKEHTAGNIGGWFNGDFNYDGKVDGADYGLIDGSFNSQGAIVL